VPAHLELLGKARIGLDGDRVEAAAALRRASSFLQDEATRLGLLDLEDAARSVSEGAPFDLAGLVEALEGVLRGYLSAEELSAEILIVEDEPTSALLARGALEGPGRTIQVVRTGERARAALADHPVDLVVLDLILPDTDGRHLLMELSRELDASRTSVVVLTVSGTPTTRAECFAYGASACLDKPLDPTELSRVVADLLRRGRPGDQRSTSTLELPDRGQMRESFLRMQAERAASEGPLVLAIVETDPSGRGWDEEGNRPLELRELHGRVARAIQEGLGLGDALGRWGVSEFVVLFSGRDPEACVRVLERAQVRVERGARSFVAGVTEIADGAQFEDAVTWASRLVSEARMTDDAAILHTTLSKTRAPFVLVVEDDPITASLLRHRFERSGFDVELHDDGLRGLDAIRRTLPDLLILDIRLPGMDGFEILSRMKEEGMTENVRTIVLTGLGREADVTRAFSLGADDYLVKPFSPVELTARALRLVRR
jgi:DNA-binding response OmpR family regulator